MNTNRINDLLLEFWLGCYVVFLVCFFTASYKDRAFIVEIIALVLAFIGSFVWAWRINKCFKE